MSASLLAVATATAGEDTAAVPRREVAPSGFGRVQPPLLHAWGDWVVLDQVGGVEELQARVCRVCEVEEVVGADCLGPRWTPTAPGDCAGGSGAALTTGTVR